MSNLKAAFIAAQTALTALESGAHILNTVLAMNEATKAVSYPRIIWRASTTRRAIAVKAIADRMAEMIGEAHAEALELDIALEGTATITEGFKMATKLNAVLNTQARPGMVVHAYGARFRINEVRNYALSNNPELQGPQNVAVNLADWIDGAIEPGYFGPNMVWNFQGNAHVSLSVE